MPSISELGVLALKRQVKVIFSILLSVFLTPVISHATVFNFSGTIDYQNVTNANLFGNGGGTTGLFSAQLNFDDTQLLGDAAATFSGGDVEAADYNFTSFSWQVGTQSWSYTGTFPNDHFGLTDGASNLAADNLQVRGGADKDLGGGVTILSANVRSNQDDGNAFSNRDASNINLFNILTGSRTGNVQFSTTGTGTINLLLSDIRMSVSAVPLPAGVWLFGSVLIGFGALRKKLKRNSFS